MNDIYVAGRTTHSITLSIADLHFQISSRNIPFSLSYDTSYRQFITTQEKTSDNTVTVSLHLKDRLPDIHHLPKVFETSESWFMLADRQLKYVVFQHPDKTSSEPVWAARIDSNRQAVDVFCDKKEDQNQDFLINPVCYPLDQILLIHCLIGKGLLIHAAGVVIFGSCYLFAGPSGAGKSTICNAFMKATGYTTLSDDRMTLCNNTKAIVACGTPWAGEAGLAVNDCAELQGIFFLTKSKENRIRELSARESLEKLFKVASLPWYDKDDLQQSFDFCENLLKQVRMYELNFRPGPDFIEDLERFITG